MDLLDRLGLTAPIVQAPMAGVSTPLMAAEVSNAGGLGSIGIGATDARGAREMIDTVWSNTARAFNVNVFAHKPPKPDPTGEKAWLSALSPLFREFGAEPPATLKPAYRSFAEDEELLALLVERPPPVVSFHFGLPPPSLIAELRSAGCVLMCTVTSVVEAKAAVAAGIDALIAQGYEAGGHRGTFDDGAPDDRLETLPLTRLLVAQRERPVIAAGGIMDGRGVRTVLDIGAVAAQLGTAFVLCPESSADLAYRAAMRGPGADHTVMTRAISGRPARCLENRFTEWAATEDAAAPDYPIAYDAGKALNAAAKAAGESGFGAQWAGQGAPMARTMPAARLIAVLRDEMLEAAEAARPIT